MKPTSLSQLKIRALVNEGEYVLAQGPHPERARIDSETLLLHIFRRNDPERNRAWLLAHWNNPTSPENCAEHRTLIQRRLAGEPIQYITGECEFYGLPFHVTPAVLIPRPETEHLVEKVLELVAPGAPGLASETWESNEPAGAPEPVLSLPKILAETWEGRILDVGTGSGAIAVALAHHLPHARITAIDVSGPALAVAEENAKRNGVSIRFLHGDLLAPVAQEQFDLIVSNPPYVSSADRDTLAVEIRDYEPAQALFAGDDGLDVYRRLIPAAFRSLAPGGFLVLEIGCGQSDAVNTLLAAAGFQHIHITPDLQGIPRVLTAQRA